MRRIVWSWIGAGLGLILGLALWGGGVWRSLDLRAEDALLPVRGIERDPAPFAVVRLDAATYRAWPEPTPAWGGHISDLVQACLAAGAKDVALDFVLAPDPRAEASVAESNATLGETILAHRARIVLGYRLGESGRPVLPAEELRLAEAEVAFLDLPATVDGTVRQGVRRSGRLASLARSLSLRQGAARTRGEEPSVFRGDFARWRIPSLSATEVGRRAAELKGKSVIIGFAGPNGEDVVELPRLGRRPGAEAQARLAATLWAGTPLRPVPNGAGLILAAGIALGASGFRRPALMLLSLPVWPLGAALALRFGWTFEWIGPLGATLLGSLLALGGKAIEEQLYRREIQSAFAYQIDEETFSHLLTNPALRSPGDAISVVATILFLDVRNSTALGASVPDADFFDRLNVLFARILPHVRGHGGTVLSFAGDGFMAVFGALRPLENDAQAAVDAAVAMVRALQADDPAIGVGLHRGEFLLGSLGGETRAQFSAIGDAVNLASRVESQTKEFGATILATAEVVIRLAIPPPGEYREFVPKNHPRPLRVLAIDPGVSRDPSRGVDENL